MSGKVTSVTKHKEGLAEVITGGSYFETTIYDEDGVAVHGEASSSERSQEIASDRWDKVHNDD
jgi:hypothetical protein